MLQQQQLQSFSLNKNHPKEQQQPQIGTQILDPTLPSDLDFDKKLPQTQPQQQQTKFNNAIDIQKPYRKTSLQGVDLLQSYTVKGKSLFNMEPKYQMRRPIHQVTEQLIEVKCYDEENGSGGLKGFWEAVVGYVKRDVAFAEGYFYIFQKKNQGLFVTHSWKLVNLFKIFIDNDDSKIRFVFSQDQKLITKDMGVKNIKHLMQKLLEQMHKFGLKLQGASNNL